MIGNYVLNIRRDGDVLTYLYPMGRDIQCMVDAMAALMQGHSVLIEPPEGGLKCQIGSRSSFSKRQSRADQSQVHC